MRALRLVGLLVAALGSLVAPCSAGAQAPGGARRVGVILPGGSYHAIVDGMRQGLREAKLEEGKQVVLDIRDAQGDLRRVEETARNLERSHVDIIYSITTSVSVATKRATAQTPIVFYAGSDPAAAGLVESLAKPGGRLTRVHSLSRELTAKRLELLKEMMSGPRSVVTFYNPDNAVSRENARLGREAARKLGVRYIERHVRSVEDLRLGLQELKPREADAYFQSTDALVISQADLVVDVARTKKLPTRFGESSIVAKGGLASYGVSYHEAGRMSARLVQRILAGTLPKDLPVENYDKIELVLDLRTAREIGLTVPLSVRDFASRVIE